MVCHHCNQGIYLSSPNFYRHTSSGSPRVCTDSRGYYQVAKPSTRKVEPVVKVEKRQRRPLLWKPLKIEVKASDLRPVGEGEHLLDILKPSIKRRGFESVDFDGYFVDLKTKSGVPYTGHIPNEVRKRLWKNEQSGSSPEPFSFEMTLFAA